MKSLGKIAQGLNRDFVGRIERKKQKALSNSITELVNLIIFHTPSKVVSAAKNGHTCVVVGKISESMVEWTNSGPGPLKQLEFKPLWEYFTSQDLTWEVNWKKVGIDTHTGELLVRWDRS